MKFDKNVPIPKASRHFSRPHLKIASLMKPGDSYFSEDINEIEKMRYWLQYNKRKNITRTVIEGGKVGKRIWRLEDV